MRPDTPETTPLAAWLGDAPETPGGPPPLAQALDALYAAGPEPAAARRAQARARQALRAERAARSNRPPPPAVFYDVAARTPIGPVFVAVSQRGLVAVRFGESEAAFRQAMARAMGAAPARSAERAGEAARQVADYLAGRRTRFDLPLDLSASTDFQRAVLRAACQIPRGQVATYTDVARRIGRPGAARAVGQALRRNPVPIVVPCHRVLATDGSLRGYQGPAGLATKQRLLELEGVRV
jgi:methylated-DNA-[protein]-cysteine S-methyltransferase